MPNLISDHGTVITDHDSILNETMTFYKNLYTERVLESVNLKDKLKKMNVLVLNSEKQNLLEGEICREELLFSLQKNNRSPGSDGFTMEFFIIFFFWKDIGVFLLRSINYSFLVRELSTTQKEGILTRIPKQGKHRQLLKNWRPIFLLNFSYSYKLASAWLANRLKKYYLI